MEHSGLSLERETFPGGPCGSGSKAWDLLLCYEEAGGVSASLCSPPASIAQCSELILMDGRREPRDYCGMEL